MNTGKSEITEITVNMEHFFGLYLAGEGQNVLEIAGFVRFRQCRWGFKKISSKNIKFSSRSSETKICLQTQFFFKKNLCFSEWNDLDL